MLGRRKSISVIRVLFLDVVGMFTTRGYAQDPRSSTAHAGANNSIVGFWRNAQGHARFNADGTVDMNGDTGRYEVQGNQVTLMGQQGQVTLFFEIHNDVLTLTLNGVSITMNRVREEAGPGSIRAELVGKWCWVSVVNAQHGTRISDRCFTLSTNGTYQYYGLVDRYNPYGGAGVEFKIGSGNHWSLKGEYLFADFGTGLKTASTNLTFVTTPPPPPPPPPSSSPARAAITAFAQTVVASPANVFTHQADLTTNTFRIGFNYRF